MSNEGKNNQLPLLYQLCRWQKESCAIQAEESSDLCGYSQLLHKLCREKHVTHWSRFFRDTLMKIHLTNLYSV